MTAKAYDLALAKDYKFSKLQWEELVKILEDNYLVKAKDTTGIYLNIPKEDKADIEILKGLKYSTFTFRVELWCYKLPEDWKHLQCGEFHTLSEVISRINSILQAVKFQSKYGEELKKNKEELT